MLELQGVTLHRGGRVLLRDITLRLRSGEILGLVGPNGIGKSTLLSAASGELPVAAGRILLDGISLDQYSLPMLAQRRAVLGQQYRLDFAFTVREVVGFGRMPYVSTETRKGQTYWVDRAMDLAGVTELAARFCPELSGGEQQRVHFARILAQVLGSPEDLSQRILFLDEPTNHLDLSHQSIIGTEIKQLARFGLAVFAVLHDINLTAAIADRLLLLGRGGILAEGSPADILTEENLQALYGNTIAMLHGAEGRLAVMPMI